MRLKSNPTFKRDEPKAACPLIQALGKSLKKVNGGWVAKTPEGTVKARFTERNEFGVLDH